MKIDVKGIFRRMRKMRQGFCAASYRPSSELQRHAEERVRNEQRIAAYYIRRYWKWF